MELHDTLYLEGGGLLRTHTSPVKLGTLQRHPPPIRILAPGNAYRRDFFDATHAPMFAQLEGLAVDEGITFADLKATLTHFVRRFYGTTPRTRRLGRRWASCCRVTSSRSKDSNGRAPTWRRSWSRAWSRAGRSPTRSSRSTWWTTAAARRSRSCAAHPTSPSERAIRSRASAR